MLSTKLTSTRIKIPSPALNYLSTAPKEEKEAVERDINRCPISINGFNLQNNFAQDSSGYANSQNKFTFAKDRISEVIEAQYQSTEGRQREYFSYLVINLTYQQFLNPVFNGLVFTRLTDLDITVDLETNGITTFSNDHSLTVYSDRVDLLYKRTIAYGTVENPKYFDATFTWHFYPDKTMAFEIVGPNEHKEHLNKIFAGITSGSVVRAICSPENAVQNDPYLFLLTDFITRSYLEEKGYEVAELSEEDIAKIYAIERLSSGRPYTIARMIDSYMKNNNIEIGPNIYDKLSESAKGNLRNIAEELKKRQEVKGISLTIGDAIDIIINFFLKVAKYFNMKVGESYIANSQFNEFCDQLKVENVTNSHIETWKNFYSQLTNNGQALPIL
jgi:hypothetical protein